MGVKFTANARFREEFSDSAEARQFLERKVRAASAHAQGISPVLFGQYRSKHVVGDIAIEGGNLTMAWGNEDIDANIVEFGAKGTPAYKPLTRSAELEGFEFHPS